MRNQIVENSLSLDDIFRPYTNCSEKELQLSQIQSGSN